MPKIIYAAVLNVVLVSACSFAAIHHVPDDYTTVQQAIDSCTNGDTVLLAEGTYAGNGNRDIDFRGKAITVRSTDPKDMGVVLLSKVANRPIRYWKG